MKKIFSIFLISFFSIVILSGCQAVKKKSEKIIKKEDDMLSKFLGRSVEELKNDMGKPSETHYSDNGNKVLVYKTTNQHFSEISELFFSMGRLHEIKGFDIVIDAFSLFLKDNPNYNYIKKSWNDHTVVIKKFGRYPHRNKILNRQSTLEEIEFLKGPNSSW